MAHPRIYCHLPPSPTLKKIWWRENFSNTAPVTLPKYKTFCRKGFPKIFFLCRTTYFFENFSKNVLHGSPFLRFFFIFIGVTKKASQKGPKYNIQKSLKVIHGHLVWIWYEFKKTIWSPTLTSGHVCVRVKHCFFLKRFYSIFHPRNPLNIEYQSFFESRFLDFEQLFWSCDSPLKVGPLLKIWTHLAQRTLIYWPKCPSTSLREKFSKKLKNSKTVKCIGISMQNHPRGWISQIYQKTLVESAC